MKSFKNYISEKREIGIGSRVIVDQNRFRSGRSPGRKLEKLTGTVKKMKEDGSCFVEFDRAVSINGKKCQGMHMGGNYLSHLDESLFEGLSSTEKKTKNDLMKKWKAQNDKRVDFYKEPVPSRFHLAKAVKDKKGVPPVKMGQYGLFFKEPDIQYLWIPHEKYGPTLHAVSNDDIQVLD